VDDYYLDEKGLAAYFEVQWLDKVREAGFAEPLQSSSKQVPDSFIQSPFFVSTAELINNSLAEAKLMPVTMLEVGPALGRTCYELVKSNSTLSDITLVEPSARLLSNFKNLLTVPGVHTFPYIKGLKELAWLDFNTSGIASECSHVNFVLVDQPFDSSTVDASYDLTVCLNVVDQCESPMKVVEGLMNSTRAGGVLVLSTTYQWSKAHLLDGDEAVDDINSYFNSDWKKLNESDIEYRFRHNERYSKLFLSHVVVYQRVIIPFITNFKSRRHAAASILFGGKPPLALLGRSLL
jgi:hypothetical protein